MRTCLRVTGRRHRLPAAFAPALLAVAGGLFGGCALPSRPAVPDPVSAAVPEMPGDFAGSPSAGAGESSEWWRAFSDPVLDRVVNSVLASNFDMAEAVARIEQARTRARLADAAILPVVGARAGVDSFDTPINAGIGAQFEELGLSDTLGAAGFALPDRLGITTYTFGADFAYEIDFWGRARHQSLAAGAELLASESDLEAARIGILAETIATYFEIVFLRRQSEIAADGVEVLEAREQLIVARYDSGLADSLSLYRVRQNLRNTQANLPQLDSLLAEAEARLAVLLGGSREDALGVLPDSLAPTQPADPVPVGIPADLLLQRPDLRAAGHRLEAAAHTVEARRAKLMPSLSFSGAIGLQSTDVSGLFDVQQWFANLVSNLVAPVFDGGRLARNVELADARFDELAAAYGRTVVTAVNEVEAALTRLRNEGRRNDLLASRLEEARSSANLQSRRYESGISAYGDLLDASLTLLDVETALADSERSLALARLAVHRALGGAWTPPDEEAAEPIPAANPASGSNYR